MNETRTPETLQALEIIRNASDYTEETSNLIPSVNHLNAYYNLPDFAAITDELAGQAYIIEHDAERVAIVRRALAGIPHTTEMASAS